MIDRPAASLLVSVVSEERRGRPGPARDAALASARDDPDHRAIHFMDAAYAGLVAGDARAALALLDQAEQSSDDAELRRRAAACRAWAQQLDLNWYPGNSGAELAPGALEKLSTNLTMAPGDSETRLIEACVARGPVTLFTTRNLIDGFARSNPAAVEQMLGAGLTYLNEFSNVALDTAPAATVAWASLAQADLAFRAGLSDGAAQALETVREIYQGLEDRVGLAVTYITEGDWWSTPGSSPEVLGLDLMPMPQSSRHAALQNDERADAAYRRAGALLQGVDAPRAIGALALRRGVLAWRAKRFDQQVAWLDTAHHAFTDAGESAGCHLVVVQRLLSDLARGDFAAARRAAPTEWAAAPHGPLGQIISWAQEQGSVSFCVGLGRLFQRMADVWVASNEFERAEHALLLALPLLSQSVAVPTWAVHRSLVQVDLKRNIPVRPLVRCFGTLLRMPDATSITDTIEWLQQIEVTVSLVMVLTGMAPSAGQRTIRALQRGVERLAALLRAPAAAGIAIPPARVDLAAFLETVSSTQAQLTLEDVAQRAAGDTSVVDRPFLQAAAQSARDQIADAQILIALNRARLAERAGSAAEADQWYAEAMRRAESGGDTCAWLGVLVLGAWGKTDRALACFEDISARKLHRPEILAGLALRAGAHQKSDALFHEMDRQRDANAAPMEWSQLSDRAEAALGAGDAARALDLARQGIAQFEAAVGRLARDSDRIEATNDISAASLYQLAARACLARADDAARGNDGGQATDWRRRSFDFGEQLRAFSLRILLRELTESGPSVEARSRQVHLAATERATAYERLLAAHERNDAATIERREKELSAAEAVLADLEAELPRQLGRRERIGDPEAPFTVREAQRWLAAGSCLIAYHIIGRDLVRWGVTADSVQGSYERFQRHVIEGLVNRLLRACAADDPGREAAELSRILLAPFDDLLASHPRVVVVPFGPLHAVPFHALPFRGEPLGATHVVSYLPAASLLDRTPLDDSLNGYGAVAVGDPAFDTTDNPGLRRLPGAQLEARHVGRLYGTRDVLIDAEASEARLRQVLAGRAVVHLAAHGQLDETAPNTSAIVLSGHDRFTVSDLIGLRIDAGLVVLSACDTGRGSAMMGGDVIGLVRGLLAAGVRRAVVSLWPVDDVVACVTMVVFHEELVKGTPPALALALAQRAVRAMSGAQLAARYRDLGGDVRAGVRSARRRSDDGVPFTRAIPLDQEYTDADDSSAGDEAVLDGRLACAWAPFVLIGS